MLTPLIRNEQRKMLASAFNTLGIAFVVTGMIGPIAAYVLGSLPIKDVDVWRPATLVAIYGVFGVSLIAIAQRVLRRLE